MRLSRRTFAAVGLVATFGLVAAACGSDSDGDTGSSETTAAGGAATESSAAGGAASSGDKPKITLVANAWTASALDAEIAKQLIESELGNSVTITSIDENTMFTGLADGTLDAVLEIWPSGITADEQAYFDDGSVVDLGDLGAVGKIGWWVPDYVLEEYPTLATWEGFEDPEVAKAFATAETGDKGRFLGTDPSYSQYDESIIAGLGLPLQVVFSGSEPSTVAELDAKVAAKEPIVLYWWTPTAAVAAYNLQNVALPEYTEECYADLAAVACDYPEDVLIKAASAELGKKDPAVLAFLQKFSLSTEDQLSMLPAVEIDKREVSEVAAEWIAENEAVWSTWLG